MLLLRVPHFIIKKCLMRQTFQSSQLTIITHTHEQRKEQIQTKREFSNQK
jgi:hypothetical protein